MANRLARKNVQVEMICFDQGHEKIQAPENVHVTYILRQEKNRIGNFLRYLSEVTKHVWNNRKTLKWVIVSGTIEFCGILPFTLKQLARNSHWILDIRTCSVVPQEQKRKLNDWLLRISSYFFENVTVISKLVAKRLKIENFEVLPLGADCYVDLANKYYDDKNLNFLYVGKFDDRKIEDVIEAFDLLCGKLSNQVKLRLDIVGFAERQENYETVMKKIGNSNYRKNIVYHGRKSHSDIKKLFQDATIGFSYVPVTEFFDVQPPTKTYEYIMNGIICVATCTKANAEIINEKNGVLTADNAASVLSGIEEVISKLEGYDTIELSQSVNGFKWENIVNNFYEYLSTIDSQKV
ncbi:glycosyltransferase [Planococcus glaciei]|uniref:glycosyltransferase n=1 Tax=Planococcus glaciei TaxID=459472 RepID=UPI001C7378AA|nr:glycosyltransferase [Planococcus glaciei]MBX0313324.1 glycosyltransferase [Planococcus glaciei]